MTMKGGDCDVRDDAMKETLSCPNELMSPKTWSRLAVQCLYSVKLVHDHGYIHRDIKPNNFVMGHRDDYERARLVHILDFGLARSYAALRNGKWVARRARGTAEFRGTLRYCSPNVHEKKEQGRRDDLWSLFYVLIELHCKLPWQSIRDRSKVETMKMNISDKHLVQNFPLAPVKLPPLYSPSHRIQIDYCSVRTQSTERVEGIHRAELRHIVPYLRTLDCYQRPDYRFEGVTCRYHCMHKEQGVVFIFSMFYNGLVALMKRLGTKPSDPYDWETKEQVAKILKHTKPAAWEDAAQFFKSDPINIHSPPLPSAGSNSIKVLPKPSMPRAVTPPREPEPIRPQFERQEPERRNERQDESLRTPSTIVPTRTTTTTTSDEVSAAVSGLVVTENREVTEKSRGTVAE
ncbi:unnamed protein product [Haemonchus placei]|uniref:non-specific serine/threonine protein kinase n=1 Tax=Haemonchus placei TaxID=6290 RepID=A0A0N4WJF8_HAEPC|nr:unnamed protein product [Haemonchus placei]